MEEFIVNVLFYALPMAIVLLLISMVRDCLNKK